ncbi:MAG: DUF4494 family protein [Alloprevotella sp.]
MTPLNDLYFTYAPYWSVWKDTKNLYMSKYLVRANTFTEAKEITLKNHIGIPRVDKVVAARVSRIMLFGDRGECLFKVKFVDYKRSENGVKEVSDAVLVEAADIREAYDRFRECRAGAYRITSISNCEISGFFKKDTNL